MLGRRLLAALLVRGGQVVIRGRKRAGIGPALCLRHPRLRLRGGLHWLGSRFLRRGSEVHGLGRGLLGLGSRFLALGSELHGFGHNFLRLGSGFLALGSGLLRRERLGEVRGRGVWLRLFGRRCHAVLIELTDQGVHLRPHLADGCALLCRQVGHGSRLLAVRDQGPFRAQADKLSRQGHIVFGGVAGGGIGEDALPGAGALADANVLADDGLEDLSGQGAVQLVEDQPAQPGTGVVPAGQHAGEDDVVPEPLANVLEGSQQDLQPVQGQDGGFHWHDGVACGQQGVPDQPVAQAGGAVDDAVLVAVHPREQLSELPSLGGSEVVRDRVELAAAGRQRDARDDVLDWLEPLALPEGVGEPVVVLDSEPARRGRLAVEIHQQDALAQLAKGCREVHGRGRLARATLFVDDRYRLHRYLVSASDRQWENRICARHRRIAAS